MFENNNTCKHINFCKHNNVMTMSLYKWGGVFAVTVAGAVCVRSLRAEARLQVLHLPLLSGAE